MLSTNRNTTGRCETMLSTKSRFCAAPPVTFASTPCT